MSIGPSSSAWPATCACSAAGSIELQSNGNPDSQLDVCVCAAEAGGVSVELKHRNESGEAENGRAAESPVDAIGIRGSIDPDPEN